MAGTIATGTVGSNIKYNGNGKALQRLVEKLTSAKRHEETRGKHICYKAGAPASNTANDNPANLYDLCIDITNNHLYICTVYDPTGAASTWTQIA
jgi:hypothetical protein